MKKNILFLTLLTSSTLLLSACTKSNDLKLGGSATGGGTGQAESDSTTLKSQSINLQLKEKKMNDTKTVAKPSMQIDKTKKYTAVLNTTEGSITIELKADETPITVNNFVYLAKQNFYNNTIFHRVIDGFMIQGGDPLGTGAGSPGYRFDDEPFKGEYKKGTVAMANAGPNTNGSQFFIMHQDYALPKNYVIFGQVIEGLEIVDKIATAKVEPNAGGEMSKPADPVTVQSVEIIEE